MVFQPLLALVCQAANMVALRITSAALIAFAAFSVPSVTAQEQAQNAETVWLSEHNKARADFGVKPLVWSDKLTKEAEGWAIKLAREGRIYHSSRETRNGTGENLWMGSTGWFRPKQMTDGFINEKQYFKPGVFPRISKTGNWADVGHYTAIVWPETQQVGCALAKGPRMDVLVCRYYPAGNIIGTELRPRTDIAAR